jgi:hypothetical protein
MADKRFTKEMSKQPKLKLKELSQFAAGRRIVKATFTKFW